LLSSINRDALKLQGKNMDSIKCFVSCLLLIASCGALAGAPPTFNLPHNKWRMISLPASPPGSANTLEKILADDIVGGVYGQNWVVYAYNAESNGYGHSLALKDKLEKGRGYWIIQLVEKNKSMTLAMPQDSSDTPHNELIPLTASKNNSIQWSLAGNPFASPFNLARLRLITTASSCSDGSCRLDKAEDSNLLHNKVWTYNGNGYKEKSSSNKLEPWEGFWVAALSGSSGHSLALSRRPSDESVQLPASLVFTEEEKAEQRSAAQELKAQILAAIEAEQPYFTVTSPRHYRFNSSLAKTPIRIAGSKHKMVIDFGGSTFWLEDTKISGSSVELLSLSHCENLTIKNMFVDWDPVPYVQGEIVSVNEKTKEIEILLDENFQTTVPSFMHLPYKNTPPWVYAFLFNPATREYKDYQAGSRVIPFFNTTPVAPRTYRTTIKSHNDWDKVNMEVGDLIVTHLRGSRPTIETGGSKNISFENITLYSSSQIGFSEGNGEGPIHYSNCKITRRPDTTRLISAGADGINSMNQENGPIIRNALFEYNGDDAIHIHGSLTSVLHKISDKEYILGFTSRGKLKNETIDFYTWDRLSYVGQRKIIAWEKISNWSVPSDISSMKKFSEGQLITAYKVTLDAPISIPLPSVYSMDSYSGRNAIIENSIFKNTFGKGVLVMSPNMQITNNYFEHIGLRAVQICNKDITSWKIGVMPYGTAVVDNKMHSIGFSSTVPNGELFRTYSYGNRDSFGNIFKNNFLLGSPL